MIFSINQNFEEVLTNASLKKKNRKQTKTKQINQLFLKVPEQNTNSLCSKIKN